MFEQLKKFPFGYYVCCLSFTFERAAYYTAKWGIAIFLVLATAKGGLGLDQVQGSFFTGQLVAWTYITPVIGGYIADRWVSPRLLVPIGEILMAAGYFTISRATGTGGVWLCIILIALGTGLFKGNVSGINGRQFANDKDTLTTAFSFQYAFVNIGSFVGTTFITLVATMGGVDGYRRLFMICAILLVVDTIWWILGQKSMGDAGKKPFLIDNRTEDINKVDMKKENKPLTPLEKKRTFAIILLTVLSGIFWIFWYLAYNPAYYEFGPLSQGGSGWANWTVGSFEMPSAWADSMNAILCICLCPIFAALWNKLSKKGKDLSMLSKTAIGIMLLGLSIASLALGAMIYEKTQTPVGIWVIILSISFMSFGEILFSPLGNSFISEYAPKKLLGTLLGVWPLIIFFSGLAYTPVYAWMRENFVFRFNIVAMSIFAIGIVLLVFTKKFESMINGENVVK